MNYLFKLYRMHAVCIIYAVFSHTLNNILYQLYVVSSYIKEGLYVYMVYYSLKHELLTLDIFTRICHFKETLHICIRNLCCSIKEKCLLLQFYTCVDLTCHGKKLLHFFKYGSSRNGKHFCFVFPTWHKLDWSVRRKSELRKCLHQTGLGVFLTDDGWRGGGHPAH